MAADRWSYLTLKAYTQGALTCSQDEHEDSRWRVREQLILEELDRSILVTLYDKLHRASCAAAQYDAGTFEYHKEYADQHYNNMCRYLRPYVPVEVEDKQNTEELMAGYKSVWEQTFGDMDNPETQAAIQEVVESLK